MVSGKIMGYAAFSDRLPQENSEEDENLHNQLLDITKSPYFADPRGIKDSTKAIQDAVNFARDNRLVCFFPSGTYLISDTISCEQRVQKLDQPRYTDSMTARVSLLLAIFFIRTN